MGWFAALSLLSGCALPLGSTATDDAKPSVSVKASPSPDAPAQAPSGVLEVPGRAIARVTPPDPYTTPSLRTDAPPGNVALLAYADRLRSMGPSETAVEIGRLSEASDLRHVPFNDLQLAVALLQGRGSQDSPRAQALLQRLLANGSEEARRLQPLARLLLARLSDQRRLEDQIDRQAQQLRDNQRRIDQLNDRLEAVRTIERSLTRNGNPLAPPSSPSAPNGTSRP